MKLSELLNASLAALQNQRASCADYGDGYGRKQVESDMNALRAITPALVAFALVAYEPHTCLHPSKESCPICGLYNALKAAGVSCE